VILNVKIAKIIPQMIVLLVIKTFSCLVISVIVFVLQIIIKMLNFKFVHNAKLCVKNVLDQEISNAPYVNLIIILILI